MLSDLMKKAREGEALWLPDLRERFEAEAASSRLVIRLLGREGETRDYPLPLPRASGDEERAFVLRYAAANVYNLLSAHSARRVILFGNDVQFDLLAPLPGLFDAPSGLGKAALIARRIHGSFGIVFAPLSSYVPAPPANEVVRTDLAGRLRALAAAAAEKSCIGADVGGSDIKLAVSVRGKLAATKEFDWNPAASPTAEGILEPLLDLIREGAALIHEQGGTLDAVGISFPDVVIDDRITGGESPKTKGMRDNPTLDYEEEFQKFGRLKEAVLPLCTPGGSVHLTNDGNMAAFTAAVELACGGEDDAISSGVIAHSLGTDLGTGWLRPDGTIPAVPLELYDLLLDLGDIPSAAFDPEDLRSTRNENSGMNGVRRYLGQAAAYRLAYRLDREMIRDFVEERDGLLVVPTEPVDLRKPCLAHLMCLAEEGKPEAEEVFRQIGRNLSVVTREMAHLFGPLPERRFLFGRFVKSHRCYELLCEGFEEAGTGVQLLVADEGLANSDLMRQLAQTSGVSVAQFAQAIGSIVFALS